LEYIYNGRLGKKKQKNVSFLWSMYVFKAKTDICQFFFCFFVHLSQGKIEKIRKNRKNSKKIEKIRKNTFKHSEKY